MARKFPLEGYRIIDMTEVWAGPTANSLMGDLGAEVIRVESYPRVAQTRPAVVQIRPGAGGLGVAGPPDAPRPWERSFTYHIANRNKLAIALNATHPRGKELLYRLISTADAFLIGYTAGTAERMGLDYQTLIQYKPDLVVLTFSGWGEAGPYQGYATLGSGVDAWAGHHYLRTYPGSDPDPTTIPGSVHSDAPSAVTIAFALLAALHYRERTGRGQLVDLSMGDMLLNHLPRAVMEWVMNNRVAPPVGNVDPDAAPMGCYPCSGPDDWVVIVVRTDAQWEGLKRALGHPAWAEERRFATAAGRIQAREAIDERLREWTRERTPVEVMEVLQREGVAAGPVNRPEETFMDRQLRARGYYRWVLHPVTGQYQRPGPMWAMSRTPVEFRRHTNLLGEHNKEVFCGLLGLSEEEYEELLAEQVTGTEYSPEFA